MTQRAITVQLIAMTGPYQTQMARAAASTRGFEAAAERGNTATGRLAGGLDNVAGKMLAAGGIGVAVSQGVGLLTDYEDALVGVGKTTGLTGDDLSALGDDITGLARKLEGGAEELLGIAQTAAQLGVAEEDILEFTEVVAGIASATNLTTDQAATDFARFSNIMGTPITEVDRLGSTVVDLGNNLATTESDIVNLSTRLAAAGSQAGFTESDVLGLSAGMSQVGIEAEAGGTAVSKALRDINGAVIESGDELDAFAEAAGMSADEFAAAWEDDAASAFVGLLEGLREVSDAGGDVNAVLSGLGIEDSRQQDVFGRLVGDVDGVTEALGIANDAYSENTALAEEVEAANARASVAIDNLKDVLKELAREALGGEEGTSSLAEGISGLTTALGFLADNEVDLLDVFMGGGESAARIVENLVGIGDEAKTMGEKSTEAKDGLDDLAEGIDFVGDEADDAGDEVEDLATQLQTLADELLKATSPAFAYVSAAEAADVATANFAAAVEEYGAASPEATEAALDLTEALVAEDAAALNAGETFVSAKAKINDFEQSNRLTADAARLARDAIDEERVAAEAITGEYLVDVVTTLDMSALNDFENEIDRLKRRANIPVTVGSSGGSSSGSSGRSSGGGSSVPAVIRNLEGLASGGPFMPGTYMVGEEGPEVAVFGQAGTMLDAQQTAALLRPAPAGGGGTSGQTITTTTYSPTMVFNGPTDPDVAAWESRKFASAAGFS